MKREVAAALPADVRKGSAFPDRQFFYTRLRLEIGEAPRDAASRELKEETGVRSVRMLARTRDWLTYDIPDELLGIAWGGRYRGQKQIWFAARFEGPESEIDLNPREGHEQEFDAWRWAVLAEVPSLVVPFKRDVYEQVVAELGPLVG